MNKDAGNEPQQRLTPLESSTIIVNLCADEAREKRLARQVVGLQAAIALITTGIAYELYDSPEYAAAMFGGGLVSVLNGVLLAWRMSQAIRHPGNAHHQLRLMYFYAAERFLVVVVLLGLCLVVLKLSPLVVLGGFVMGQAVLLAARLLLNRLNKF